MAGLKKGTGRIGQVGRRPRASLLLRLAGRVTAAAVALLVFTLIGVQFARVIGENVAMASELSGVNNDISALQARHSLQLRELRRLRAQTLRRPRTRRRNLVRRPARRSVCRGEGSSAAPGPPRIASTFARHFRKRESSRSRICSA